jgi:hypothetical protein
VYYVAIDHAQRALVVAIRGTLSLQDCMTDALAVPYPMDQHDLVRIFSIRSTFNFSDNVFLSAT